MVPIHDTLSFIALQFALGENGRSAEKGAWLKILQ